MNVDLSFWSSERLLCQWIERLLKDKKIVEIIINDIAIIEIEKIDVW